MSPFKGRENSTSTQFVQQSLSVDNSLDHHALALKGADCVGIVRIVATKGLPERHQCAAFQKAACLLAGLQGEY